MLEGYNDISYNLRIYDAEDLNIMISYEIVQPAERYTKQTRRVLLLLNSDEADRELTRSSYFLLDREKLKLLL